MKKEEPFIRFIAAKKLMKRWNIDHATLSQMPINAFILVGPIDPFQPIAESFQNIRKFLPYSKEDFDVAVYDIYDIELYEHLHPENSPGGDAEEKPKPGRKCKPKQNIIPVLPKTQWCQIHFRIVNPTRIEITTPEGMEPYHPDDLGFGQKRKIWELFEQFAKKVEHTPGTLDGRAGKIHRSDVPEYINADKADISRLRRLLREAFPGIEGDPIPYEKGKGYKVEFHIAEA